jgi:hypothetical protein
MKKLKGVISVFALSLCLLSPAVGFNSETQSDIVRKAQGCHQWLHRFLLHISNVVTLSAGESGEKSMKKLKGVISVFALSLCLLSPAQAEEPYSCRFQF